MFKEKLFSNNSLFRMNKLFVSVLVLLSFLKNCYSEIICETKNTCQCVFQNGSVIDLTSLGNRNNEARWSHVKAEEDKGYEFFYNPCFSFTLGKSGDCSRGVAVCQVNKSSNEHFDCGDTNSANFVIDKNNSLHLMYHAIGKTTNVTLMCSEDAFTPEFKVIRELKENVFEMTLKTRCACPDLCAESHLSTGSVLVILFMIFVALYILLGIVHASLTRGAHGWELIPHYEFWADFPLLVRDGCVFVFSGCKPETAYDRI